MGLKAAWLLNGDCPPLFPNSITVTLELDSSNPVTEGEPVKQGRLSTGMSESL